MKLVPFGFVLLQALPIASQNFKVSKIPTELLEIASSVVRQEKTTITVLDADALEKSYYGVYTILNKNGQGHFYPMIT